MLQERVSHHSKVKLTKSRILLLILGFTVFSLGLGAVGFGKIKIQQDQSSPSGYDGKDAEIGMANPAAVYCTDLGYDFQIVDTPQGQDGVCSFENRESCKAWDFLIGKCGQSHSYCIKQGYDIKTLNDGQNAISPEYAVCVNQQGMSVGSVTDLTNLEEKAIKVKKSFSPRDKNPINALLGKIDNFVKRLIPDKTSQENPPGVPTSFDWRDYNGQNWMTSVKDQGGCGSCWSFSAVGVSEAMYNIRAGNPDLDLDLSEQYLVSDCHMAYGYQTCCGGWKDMALEYIRDNGIPDEACMTYVDGAGCSCPIPCGASCTYRGTGQCSDRTCSDRCGDWASRLTQIDSTGYVGTGQTTIKQALIAHGPLAVSFGYGSYYGGAFDENGVYRCVYDDGTNHAVSVVGYNDAGGYWILKNSWGLGYPGMEDGYMKIGYGECYIEQYVYYADVTAVEKKFIVQDSSGANVATLSDSGNIILKGTCSQSANCSAPTSSFIIQNSAGETVGYVDSSGNLCIETGDCSGGSANCNFPNGQAFLIQDSSGTTQIYIDQTGDLCLTGDAIQSGIP